MRHARLSRWASLADRSKKRKPIASGLEHAQRFRLAISASRPDTVAPQWVPALEASLHLSAKVATIAPRVTGFNST